MIQLIWNDTNFQTNGCGCCSVNLCYPEDKDEIIEELKENWEVLKEALETLDLTIEDLE